MAAGSSEVPLVHSFVLDTELAKQQLLSFPKFIRESMAFGQLPGIRMSDMEALVGNEGHYLEFKAGPERGSYDSIVRVYLTRPLKIEVRSFSGKDEKFNKQLQDVLLFALQFFEEHAKQSMLYMAFVPGSPRTATVKGGRSIIRKLFTGNMINIILMSILVSVVLFAIIGMAAPIVFIIVMLALVLSAGKLISLGSPWRITKEHRDVLLVQYVVPEGLPADYLKNNMNKLSDAKKRAYETFSSCPGTVCAESISKVFQDAGLNVEPKDFLVRRIDVYGIVERLAAKFKMHVPSIVITQDPRPNAAATGFTKKLATMLITMGLLVQLDEEEVELVAGHELSHIKSGDTIALFSLITTEYLLRVYVYINYIAPFFLPYIIAVFWGIFFFGKFLESRADLEAGIILGKPKVMAEAFKKIGFRRLIMEERFMEPGVSRFGEWLRFDPHPPLYFRIQRLESLDLSKPPKHPLLSSIRAVTRGFISSRKAA
jgi:heat shock protein HtpX